MPKEYRVNYSYNNIGKVQKVSHGTVIENSFTYDSGDRLSKITHNDFDYDIGYTEFGLLKSIKAGNGNLINYSYDSKGALTKADYGNGQSIDYKYNENGSSSAVKQGDEILYSCKYDKDGNLESIQDNCSNRETKYSTDKDEYRVTEETGSGVYHKIYCTNEKLTEIIGEKEKTLQTDLGDNSYKVTGRLQIIFIQPISIQRTNSEESRKKVYMAFTVVQTAKRLNFLKKKCTIRNISMYLIVQIEHPNWYPR